MHEPMTQAQRALVMAMTERSVECWTDGDLTRAQGWFEAALCLVAGHEYIDVDDEVNR